MTRSARIARLLPALAASLVAGCGRPEPAPAELPPYGDEARWLPEVEAFEREGREQPFPPGGIVFFGSSSIRLWDSLERDMDPLPVLERGFGGARLADAIHFAGRLVSVHRPELVVVFCGTNDLAGAEPATPAEVRALVRRLVARLREPDPDLRIVYVAITPTLAREEHLAAVREANRLIRRDCEADPRLEFVDPTADLADEHGRPDPSCFREDRLHLNERGYAVWTRHLRPVVERLHAPAADRD